MLKTTVYILIFAICSLIACQGNQNNSSAENIHDSTSAFSTTTKDLDGYWILTDYIDSILKDKSIAKHSQYPISEAVMSFRIHNDSLFSKGIILRGYDAKISRVNDTLKQIRFSRYTFYYNRKSDQIEATPFRLKSNSYFRRADKEKYIYRRVKDKRLLNILGIRPTQGFHQLFVDSLITGEYKSIKNGQMLILTSAYSMSGFKRYNKYEIFDYLERIELDYQDPFKSYDAITFREHKGRSSEIDPKYAVYNGAVYNWRFSGDTLTLIEMQYSRKENARFGIYDIGKNKFTFIRTK